MIKGPALINGVSKHMKGFRGNHSVLLVFPFFYQVRCAAFPIQKEGTPLEPETGPSLDSPCRPLNHDLLSL